AIESDGITPALPDRQRIPADISAAWRRAIEEADQCRSPLIIRMPVAKRVTVESRRPCPEAVDIDPAPVMVRRPAPALVCQPRPADSGYPVPLPVAVRAPPGADSRNPAVTIIRQV